MFTFIMSALIAVTPAPAPATTVPCTGYAIGPMTQVVTFMSDQDVTCDVRPPQLLSIVFDATDYGDAQYEQADQACAAMGGSMDWFSYPGRGVCNNVDY